MASDTDKMSSVIQRIITGAVLVIVITTSVMTSPYSFTILLLIIDLFALFEFYQLVHSEQSYPKVEECMFVSAVLFVSAGLVILDLFDWTVLLINLLPVTILFLRELYISTSNGFQDLALAFFGIIYVTLPIILFEWIAFLPLGLGHYHSAIILGYFLILWASDTGAYVMGSLVGKHKLFESISPNKTWEGSIGGAIIAIVVAWVVSLFVEAITLLDWLVICCIIIVMGTYGDLFKSLVKRRANVKDSGTLLPGHGGFLDRFDSLIGSAPMVFCYLVIFANWKS
jgi:phosphatidate cytidylyltransferase